MFRLLSYKLLYVLFIVQMYFFIEIICFAYLFFCEIYLNDKIFGLSDNINIFTIRRL